MKKEEVVTEVERYFVLPGQACAYMIGCQTILLLRERAQLALGDKFDLKRFHDGMKWLERFVNLYFDVFLFFILAVLLNGSLPLNILENVIDEFIKSEKTNME